MKKNKTLKDLKRLELTCESLHIKDYNACLEYNKLYVLYDKIRFNKLKYFSHYKIEKYFNNLFL